MFTLRVMAVFLAMFLALGGYGCKAGGQPESGMVKQQETVESGEAVAQVGGEKIMLEDVNQMITDIPKQYQAMALTRKDMFLESIINQKVLYKEALDQGIDKDERVKKQIEETTKDILIREYLKREIEGKIKVSEEDAKAYYEENKSKFIEPAKIKVSHILVEQEAEAKDILTKLSAGADFGALAKEKSKCPSKEKDGDLGFLAKGQTVPEFETVAFSLEPGQLSDVVKTQFGYHIIKVTEKQPEKERLFEEVKDEVNQLLLSQKQKEAFEALLKGLREKNNVVIYKDVLLPPSPKAEELMKEIQEKAPAPVSAPAEGGIKSSVAPEMPPEANVLPANAEQKPAGEVETP